MRQKIISRQKLFRTFTVSLLLLAPCASNISAGGLAVREQSAQFQGLSFAGSAAGSGLSSSFWNSAAIGEVNDGIFAESHFSILTGESTFETLPGTSPVLGAPGETGEFDEPAFIGASYFATRLSKNVAVGLALNTPSGLSSEFDDPGSQFRLHHRQASLLTVNANPIVSYQAGPGLIVAAGLQVEYAKLHSENASATSLPFFGGTPLAPSTVLEGDGFGFGFTLGALLKPTEKTTIGIGFRSSIAHELSGDQYVEGGPKSDFSLSLETPELVTLSFRHALRENIRLLGTVEWANWRRLDVLPIEGSGPAAGSAFEFGWDYGWFFALGGEYDHSDSLTLRAGAAYEISPVGSPEERIVQAPDSDRVWLSFGATYALSDALKVDFAYSRIIFEDSRLNRKPANGANAPLVADVSVHADIFSGAIKYRFGSF